jgi:hypothetical protein
MSSTAASRSSARRLRSFQVSASPRRPSASRRTFCAARLSSQKPGSWVWASSSATRTALVSRSKVPRGRPDLFGQVADGGRVHLVPDPEILEQDWPQLDEPQGRLASGDDGVHAGAVPVVWADSAVTVTVEGCRVAAGPTVSFACDQIDERRFLGLLHGLPLSWCRAWGTGLGRLNVPGALAAPEMAGFGPVYGANPLSPRGKSGSASLLRPVNLCRPATTGRQGRRVRPRAVP